MYAFSFPCSCFSLPHRSVPRLYLLVIQRLASLASRPQGHKKLSGLSLPLSRCWGSASHIQSFCCTVGQVHIPLPDISEPLDSPRPPFRNESSRCILCGCLCVVGWLAGRKFLGDGDAVPHCRHSCLAMSSGHVTSSENPSWFLYRAHLLLPLFL